MKGHIFLRDKPSEVLVFIKNYSKEIKLYQLKISRGIECSADYTYKVLMELGRMKLIKQEREGRRVYISLTNKGESISDELLKIKELTK